MKASEDPPKQQISKPEMREMSQRTLRVQGSFFCLTVVDVDVAVAVHRDESPCDGKRGSRDQQPRYSKLE